MSLDKDQKKVHPNTSPKYFAQVLHPKPSNLLKKKFDLSENIGATNVKCNQQKMTKELKRKSSLTLGNYTIIF